MESIFDRHRKKAVEAVFPAHNDALREQTHRRDCLIPPEWIRMPYRHGCWASSHLLTDMTVLNINSAEDLFMWTKPSFEDLRIGFEVTMYFSNR